MNTRVLVIVCCALIMLLFFRKPIVHQHAAANYTCVWCISIVAIRSLAL